MKRLIFALLSPFAALGQLVEPIPFDSGYLATAAVYSARSDHLTYGQVSSIDVAPYGTGAVSLSISTVSTNGSLVAKTILAVPSLTAAATYYPRAYAQNTVGGNDTNQVTFLDLVNDRILVTITNINLAITNGARVKINLKR